MDNISLPSSSFMAGGKEMIMMPKQMEEGLQGLKESGAKGKNQMIVYYGGGPPLMLSNHCSCS